MIKNNKIYTMAQQGLFFDELSKHNDKIYCFFHQPLNHEIKLMDYTIKEKNVELLCMGYHTKIYFRLLFNSYYTKVFNNFNRKFDVLIIRQPTPLLSYFGKLKKSRPLIILTVDDAELEVSANQQYYIKRKLIQLYALENSVKVINSQIRIWVDSFKREAADIN